MKHMSKFCVISALIFVSLFPIFAGGTVEVSENDYWVAPNTNTTNPYYHEDLAVGTFGSELMQIGSTLYNRQITLQVTPFDPSIGYQLVHENNSTQTHPFTLQLLTQTVSRTYSFNGWTRVFTYNNWVPSNMVTAAFPNYQYTFPRATLATGRGAVSGQTYYGSTASFINAFLSVQMNPVAGNLESGIYTSKINVRVTAPASGGEASIDETHTVVIKAKYRVNVDTGSGFTDFNLSIEPTADTFSFDLQNNSRSTSIANIHFTYTQISNSQISYGTNPLVIGVSPVGTSWDDTSGSFVFKRTGAELQPNTTSNSISHNVSLSNGAVNSSQLTGNRVQLIVPQTVKNQSISSGQQYRNVFDFNGQAYIQVTGTNQQELLSGRYSTNLYFYIIKN